MVKTNAPTHNESTTNTFSLQLLFCIVTGCALFFAVFRLSPKIALALTLLLSPALIRTHLFAEKYRAQAVTFTFKRRLKAFCESIAVVLGIVAVAICTFGLVSLGFGFFAMLLGAVMGMNQLRRTSIVLGTASGMVWGISVSLLVTVYSVMKIWVPKVRSQTF